MKKAKNFGDMTTETLKCRNLGHAWDPQTTYLAKNGRKQVLQMELACLRCAAERTDLFYRSTGERVKRPPYKYGGNYLLEDAPAWGNKKTFKNNVRAELGKRLLRA